MPSAISIEIIFHIIEWIFIFTHTHLYRIRQTAAAAARSALSRGETEAAKTEAKLAVRVPEHLIQRICVALRGRCEVRLCRQIEADHAILAAFTLGEVSYVLSNDMDFLVMVRKYISYLFLWRSYPGDTDGPHPSHVWPRDYLGTEPSRLGVWQAGHFDATFASRLLHWSKRRHRDKSWYAVFLIILKCLYQLLLCIILNYLYKKEGYTFPNSFKKRILQGRAIWSSQSNNPLFY